MNIVKTGGTLVVALAAALCTAGCSPSSEEASPSIAWNPDAPSVQAQDSGSTPDMQAGEDSIDMLVDELVASSEPTEESAYIELIGMGDTALQYVARALLAGNQAADRAEVMFSLMQELLGDEAALVEAELSDLDATANANAQERFNAWFMAAGILLDRHGLDYMHENMPHTYALLTAVQG